MASGGGFSQARDGILRWSAFALGIALSLVLVARSQVGGDQLNLLARGWLLVARGIWIPYGNPTSAGGDEPGGVTALVVALPLWVWRNHHAAALFVLLSHIGAYWLIDDVLRRTTTSRERLLFAALYWLNPWRLYFSGHLWNPNFLFLAGALHTWTACRQRVRARWHLSVLHVATIGFAMQLHPSAIVLALASAVLIWTRGLRLHVVGGLIALAAVLASLVPWLHEVARTPAILPGRHGFIGRGLILVFPLLRGLLYWVRYGSLSVGNQMMQFDFTGLVGVDGDRWLAPAVTLVAKSVGVVSVAPAVCATVWLLRRAWRRRQLLRDHRRASGRRWIQHYVVSVFAAAVVMFALAPTTVMLWQGLVVMHVAVLALVLWLGVVLRTRRAATVHHLTGLAVAMSVLLVGCMAVGTPEYRCGGRDNVVITLRENYPMIHDLAIDATCAVPIDPEHGWAPDVRGLR
jgi:hypothetical protein